jgi:hypothetical protein
LPVCPGERPPPRHVDGAFELFAAASQRFDLPLEAGDVFGFWWVGLVGWVEFGGRLLWAFDAGSHVTDQRRRLVDGHRSDATDLCRAGGLRGTAGLDPHPRQLSELVLIPAAGRGFVEHGVKLGRAICGTFRATY